MEKLKIEKGIKLINPIFKGQLPAEHPYPLADMEVGDSFFVSCNNAKRWGYNLFYSRIYSAVTRYRKEQRKIGNYKIFAIRTVDKGFRCWRTK